MSPPKSCAVCGDKALGYNFSAVTCESCKAFFRRNALAKKQFTCPFNQNCEITVVTRRFCQKCRLKKCLDIGMKSENIMSEEDKQIKRRKIENNRAKRRLNEQKGGEDSVKNETATADSNEFDGMQDSRSCGSFESNTGSNSMTQHSTAQTIRLTAMLGEPMRDVNPVTMTGEEMVEFIVCDPDRATQAISKLMRSPTEALVSLEKIINSQKDALKLISHLIAYPGDALKIISNIMNSPFDALTVFTKFMSSPTDALEIISKVVSSPQDVLNFIKNLMDSPEDALDIMNKFMNTPAEALKILNKIFNGPNATTQSESSNNSNSDSGVVPQMVEQQTPLDSVSAVPKPPPEMENHLLHSMLQNSPSSTPQTIFQLVTPATHRPEPTTEASFVPSPHALSISSPVSVTASSTASTIEMQYHSPTSIQNDELPSTSAGLISSSPPLLGADDNFPSDPFDIKTFMHNGLPDNSDAGTSLNSLESVLTEVIRIEFQAFNQQDVQIMQDDLLDCNHPQQQQPVCAPSSVIMGRDLNEAELMKLRELKLASEALFYPVDDDLSILMMADERIKPGDTHQDSKLLQVINLTAVAIKRLIKMAKKITAFRDMCQEDQVALLKGGCTEMMIMRSVMTYDDDRNTWKIPHTKENMSNIRAEVLKLAKGNVYEELVMFVSTFDEKWRMDENIILIMCAIVLFTPTRSRIIHSDVIRLEQKSYYYLLRRYLESIYPGCEAKSAFIKLIKKISDIERLNQFIIGVYLNVNPSQVEPLLREIFDLKNH